MNLVLTGVSFKLLIGDWFNAMILLDSLCIDVGDERDGETSCSG